MEDLDITLHRDKASGEEEAVVIRPDAEEESVTLKGFEDDRYSRLRLISWWDQEKLEQARIMVVGAGALGNEILKNAALLGIGNIIVIDLDTVENSNLTRSVLFREKDDGRSKAIVAAEGVREINPAVRVVPIQGNVMHDVGLGVFRRMDVVLGGLDNREARLFINDSCWKVNRPWIDGAIEILHGVAKVFVPPDSACYGCTLTELDLKLLAQRKSCALLTKDDLLEGKVPTTPTTSSVIAGIQVQEAVKLIHKNPALPVLAGKGFVFNGVNHDSYVVVFPRKEDCQSHFTFDDVIELDKSARSTTFGEMLEVVRSALQSPRAILELYRDVVCEFCCEKCNEREPVFRILGKVTEREARCPSCGEIRKFDLAHTVSGEEDFLDETLAEVGIPLFDIVSGRVGLERSAFFEFTGDKREAMGILA